MGQYYYVVNLDKKEFLHPHRCGDGLKLMEFACAPCGTMSALAILLADGNGRGGGDLCSENSFVGRWAGDRIVVAGDYADEGKWGAPPDQNLVQFIGDEDSDSGWRDISLEAMRALAEDSWAKDRMRKRWTDRRMPYEDP